MSEPTTPLVKRWRWIDGELQHVGMAPRPRTRHAAETDDADLDDLKESAYQQPPDGVGLDPLRDRHLFGRADADQPEWQS